MAVPLNLWLSGCLCFLPSLTPVSSMLMRSQISAINSASTIWLLLMESWQKQWKHSSSCMEPEFPFFVLLLRFLSAYQTFNAKLQHKQGDRDQMPDPSLLLRSLFIANNWWIGIIPSRSQRCKTVQLIKVSDLCPYEESAKVLLPITMITYIPLEISAAPVHLIQ